MPWRRLFNLFAVYAVIAIAAVALFARDAFSLATVGGLAMGLAIYLVLAWVLVKFGWNPPALRPGRAAAEAAERRAAADTARRSEAASGAATGPRPKPPPTRRTNAGNRRARR